MLRVYFGIRGMYKGFGGRGKGGGMDGAGAVVETACLESRRWRCSNPTMAFKETKCFLYAHSGRFKILGSLRDREVACSTSDRRGSNFVSCVRRTVSSHSSYHPQGVLLAQFSLYICAQIPFISFRFISFVSGYIHDVWMSPS